jgi:TPR repeat protein
LVVSTAGASGSDGGGSGASPGSALEMKLGHLKALALAESKKTSSGSGGDGKSPHSFSTTTTPTKQPPPSNANGSQQEQQAQQQQQQAPLEAAFRVAEDPLDPRYAMACADIGAAYAVGAHGVAKDLSQAEHFLSLSAKAGDVMATRNLGLVLLDLNRFVGGCGVCNSAVAAAAAAAAIVYANTNVCFSIFKHYETSPRVSRRFTSCEATFATFVIYVATF